MARIDTDKIFAQHPFAKTVLGRLVGAGHEAVLIGGVVRDALQAQMGRRSLADVCDVDIATSALPHEVRRLFAGVKIIGVGESFGVLVLVAPDGRAYEVATFRVEKECDGRWPGEVRLVRTLAEDVLRRDLTINGLAATEDGSVIDLVDGVADLRARRVRAIGDPCLRFEEDRLRMLRVIRFACQIDGQLDPETAAAISENAARIVDISRERIGKELLRLLETRRAAMGLELMDQVGLLDPVLPELSCTKGVPQPEEYHPEGDVFVHTLEAVRIADRFIRDPIVKLAVVLHDVGKPDALARSGGANMGGHCALGSRMAKAAGARLRLSRQEIGRLAFLVRQHMRIADLPRMGRGKQVLFVSEGERPEAKTLRHRFPLFIDLLQVLIADCEASAHRSSGWIPILRETLRIVEHIERVCGLTRAREIIDGHILIEEGFSPGPGLGRILETLHDRILAGEITDREQAIGVARSLLLKQEESLLLEQEE